MQSQAETTWPRRRLGAAVTKTWFMFWRTGSQLSTVNAFRVMKGL